MTGESLARRIIRHTAQAIGGLCAVTLILMLMQLGWQCWGGTLDSAVDNAAQAAPTAAPTATDDTGAPTGAGDGTDTGEDAGDTPLNPNDPPIQPQPAHGTAIGYITAPRLGTTWRREIRQGTDTRTLNRLGAGHYETTVMPGDKGNFSLAGHATAGNFGPIHTLQNGDRITIQTPVAWYVYEVTGSEIVDRTQTSVINPGAAGADRGLTLTTCWPLLPVTDPVQRWVVHARFVGWCPPSDTKPPAVTQAEGPAARTPTDMVVDAMTPVAQATRLPALEATAVTLTLAWACLDTLAWGLTVARRHAKPRDTPGAHRETSWNPLTLLWRAQAGPPPVRILLLLVFLTAMTCAWWQWAGPWVAATIPLFAAPTPLAA